MNDAIKISEIFSASPQLQPQDLAQVKQAGFTTLINNRPDGEAEDQPSSAELARDATAVGLNYLHIPIRIPDQVNAADIEQFNQALEQSTGPVFAFCRTGTRSSVLWTLAQALYQQRPLTEVINQVQGQGMSLERCLPVLHRFAEPNN